jgi:hypothetical protein
MRIGTRAGVMVGFVALVAVQAAEPTFEVSAGGGSCETGTLYRFAIQNQTGETLGGLLIRQDVAGLSSDTVRVLCPIATGECKSEDFTPGQASGDGFACRARVDLPHVDAVLTGSGASGKRVEIEASGESPVPEACAHPLRWR